MEVSSIGIPLSHPLHLCSLPPINGLLSHQSILMIVEGPKLDMMPIVLRSIIFLLKFIYLSLDNIKFFIDAAKTKVFPPEDITFSVRNTMHKGVHGRDRGVDGPSINNTIVASLILQLEVIKPENIIGEVKNNNE